MKKFGLLFVFLTPFLMAFQCHSSDKGSQSTAQQNQEKMVGNIVKNALEQYHFKNLKIDKELSSKAFDQYLKRIDFGKQFLTAAEVAKLKKYESQMHEQMVSADHKLIEESMTLVNNRLKNLEKLREETFKKQFNFNTDETIETDPDKRTYLKNDKELNDHWRKVFKQATINRYLSLKDIEVKRLEAIEKEAKEVKDGKKPEEEKVLTANEKAQAAAKKEEKPLTEAELIAQAHEKSSEQYKKLFERLQEDGRDEYLERFFNAIANVFDPHTTYLPPQKKEDFDIDISGSLEGIGAVLQEDGDFIKVVTIVPGGAAWRQKELEVDDVILGVSEEEGETVDLVGMKVNDAVRYIRGKKGTIVKLSIRKVDGSRKTIPIERDVVQIGETYAKSSVIQHNKLPWKVGYIHVPKFYRDFENNERNCTEDVKTELNRLKKEKVDAVVLDLRNNGGGALEDARTMSGLFIKSGPIVQIQDGNGRQDILRDNEKTVEYDGPLIVMVNRFSASASEILAGALQDYGRAIIVGGEQTHGKGTVQAVLNLNQGPLASLFGNQMGALKVTIQKFYRVNGASTQYKGVVPDIILPDPMGFVENREQDLEYSIPWDEIAPLKYEPWTDFSYDLDLLRSRSKQRVSQDSRMQKVQSYVNYLTERRKDTVVALNVEKLKKQDEENEKRNEELKLDEMNMDIQVSNYEASIKAHETVNKNDEKKWAEDFKKRNEEWLETIRKDAALEETLYILDDVLKARAGKQLSMVPQV